MSWDGYVAALVTLDARRRAAVQAGVLDARGRAGREAALNALGARLAGQRDALTRLATDLRAPLTDADLAPVAPARRADPTVPGATIATLAADVDLADRALRETETVGRLPQLLPARKGTIARTLGVYVAICLPNAVLAALLAGVNSWVLVAWFLVVFPLIVLVAGPVVVNRLSAPRLRSEPGALEPGPRRLFALVGLLLAWASWYVPAELVSLLSRAVIR
jgi:hypothetical protein